MPTEDEGYVYQRHMPHWRATNAIYFVTWRLARSQRLLRDDERNLVRDALWHYDGARYEVLGGAVMDDHVHVIVQPLLGYRLDTIVHSWKSFTANRMQRLHGRAGHIWQQEYFDRVVRDEAELEEKVRYVRGNPGKRWPESTEYPWVWPVDG